MLRERELHLPWLVTLGAALVAAPATWSQETPAPAASPTEEAKPESKSKAEPKKKEPTPRESEPSEEVSSGEKEAAPPDAGQAMRESTPEPPKKPAAVEPPAGQPPAESATRGKAETRAPEDDLGIVARQFFAKLLKRDIAGATTFCRTPFFFEGKSVNSPEEVRKRWAAAVSSRAVERIVLYGIDVLTPEEMVKKYGEAPSKLAAWPLKGGMITIANLSGQAAVVLWKKSNNVWSAIGYHD